MTGHIIGDARKRTAPETDAYQLGYAAGAAAGERLRAAVRRLVEIAEYRSASSLRRTFDGRPFPATVPVEDLRALLASDAQPETADQPAPAEAPDEREALAAVLRERWPFGVGNPEWVWKALADAVLAALPGLGYRRSPDDLLAEHRQAWASYIEEWSASVGPEPPTVGSIIAALRLPSPPFGMVRAADAEGSGR